MKHLISTVVLAQLIGSRYEKSQVTVALRSISLWLSTLDTTKQTLQIYLFFVSEVACLKYVRNRLGHQFVENLLTH